jgi:hypothetical protein
MSTEIKVGDVVTWRSGKGKKPGFEPLGIANCEVLALGHTAADTGEPAALLKLPAVFGGETAAARVADLEKSENP